MSVRRQTQTRKGKTREFWIVDVGHRCKDGTVTRVRKVPRLQTRRDAEALERSILRELETEAKAPKPKPKLAPTFAEFAEEFMFEHAQVNNKPSEVYAKSKLLKNHLVPAFGHIRLTQIDERMIGKYKAQKSTQGYCLTEGGQQHPFKAKSINNQLNVLRTMLNMAVEWKLIPFAPKVKMLKAAVPEFTFLSFEEAQRLKIVPDEGWRAMIVVALKTGLRLGELIALRWDSVDTAAGNLMVTASDWRGIIWSPKGSASRVVPLNREAMTVLRTHRHLSGPLVFCQPSGTSLHQDTCGRGLERAQRLAGIKRIQWHGLRHTFASHLVMRGVPLKAIQELLGHATIEMTMRCAHLTPDVRQAAVCRLDDACLPHGNAAAINDGLGKFVS